MIAENSLAPFGDAGWRNWGGRIAYTRRAGEESDVPPLYEFTWNHTTLQALKVDKAGHLPPDAVSPPASIARRYAR